MKTYELTFIITPQISSQEAEGLLKEVETFIQEQEGVILKSDKPTAQTLSYRIKKQASGFFANLELQIPEGKIKNIREKLDKNNKVIRNMIVVKNPAKLRKERRTRKPLFASEPIPMPLTKEEPAAVGALVQEEKKVDTKIELNEIDKKLDEILGE